MAAACSFEMSGYD